MKVLLVARSFWPVESSGSIRAVSLARYLPESGVRVAVLSTDGGIARGSGPLPDLHVLRVSWAQRPLLGAPRVDGRLRRWPIVSSLMQGFGRIRTTARVLAAAARFIEDFQPEIVLATAPPGEAILVGRAIAARYGIPLVADLRDPWSYWPMPLYPHYLDFLYERAVERRALASCECVIVTTEASARLANDRLGVERNRIRVVPNGYAAEDFDGAAFDPTIEPGKFLILHAGALSTTAPRRRGDRLKRLFGFQYDPLGTNYDARSPRYLLSALASVLRRHPEWAGQVRLWLVGDAGLIEDASVRSFPYPGVLRITGRLPPPRVATLCRRADLLVLMQLMTSLGGTPLCPAIPAKLYTYLRSGSRILACGQPSEIWDLVRDQRAGCTARGDQISEIASALEAEIAAWSPKSHQPLRDIPQFDRRSIALRVADELRLISGPRPATPAGSAERAA